MKFTSLTTVATSLVASAALVAGAPRVVQVQPRDLKVRKIGGSSFKLPQIHNDMFKQHGKGPRALAKIYEKYHVELPSDLVDLLRKIAQELGIKTPSLSTHGIPSYGGNRVGGSPYTNETDDQGPLTRRDGSNIPW
jgi:hypothetical protein